MVFGVGPNELMVILIVALILFGPKKLPELARSLGKAVAEFNKAKDEFSKESMKKIIENEIEPKKASYSEVVKIAENLGIDVEGKSEQELLKEITRKTSEKAVAQKDHE
jgi:sec-independent protein translocase protein TatA